jgi:hypothetical protein
MFSIGQNIRFKNRNYPLEDYRKKAIALFEDTEQSSLGMCFINDNWDKIPTFLRIK